MSEENEEKANFKVTDRRLFNADGTPREIFFEEAVAKDETTSEAKAVESSADTQTPEMSAPPTEDTAFADEEELPGANDPASFMNFLMDVVVPNAAIALGMMEHPVSGQRGVNLPLGKHWVDVLVMLKEKTKGNLHAAEQRAFDGLIAELQMHYVTITRAAAEQAKNPPKKGFTAQDILGKR